MREWLVITGGLLFVVAGIAASTYVMSLIIR